MSVRTGSLSRFPAYAWGVLIYNLAVILWGTYVRATGSGAGCGGHWPLCNGEIIPPTPQIGTLIEFAHRLTSGLSVALIALLVIWAWRVFPAGHCVRKGAAGSGILIITEALIGAALVLFGWVARDVSVARTVSISLHLINTFLLLSTLTMTAWWAQGGAPVRLGNRWWLLALGLAGVVVIGITGAVTALGDTLFPAGSLTTGLQQDVSPTASFLIRLRVIHPFIAVIVGGYLLTLLSFGRSIFASPVRFESWLRRLVLLQLIAGAVNVLLLAPIWMQLVHLGLADLVWILLVLYSAAALATDRPGQTERAIAVEGGIGARAD